MLKGINSLFGLGLLILIQGCQSYESKPERECGIGLTGCMQVAAEYLRGFERKQNLDKAYLIYNQECDRGNSRACFLIGMAYKEGEHYEQSYEKAVEFFKRACEDKDGLNSCAQIAAFELEGLVVPKNIDQAVIRLKNSCPDNVRERWSGFGCSKLAYVYQNGIGVPEDKTKAEALYVRGCSWERWACINVARMYETGDGIPKNQSSAYVFYRDACLRGEQDICMHLGKTFKAKPKVPHPKSFGLYIDGKLFQKYSAIWHHHNVALYYYSWACKSGGIDYCLQIAQIYRDTDSPNDHMKHSIDFYKKACALDSPSGCRELGDIYASGEGGITASKKRAKKYYLKACAINTELPCSDFLKS